MNIEIKNNPDNVNIVVKGDIEMMSIKNFKQQLFDIVKQYDKNIDMDLLDVNYIDSSGIGVLISINKMQKQRGKKFQITNINSKILKILKLNSLADVFNL